ncbi:cutinase, partial [Streptomyces sp. SID7499]|nr:cutinase [Streptomyces sp. SID7499]
MTQASTAQAATAAAPCEGTYTIVVGGTGSSWDKDGFTGNIQQHVGYPTAIPNGASARAGVNELNRLVRDQRAACPNQHVK